MLIAHHGAHLELIVAAVAALLAAWTARATLWRPTRPIAARRRRGSCR